MDTHRTARRFVRLLSTTLSGIVLLFSVTACFIGNPADPELVRLALGARVEMTGLQDASPATRGIVHLEQTGTRTLVHALAEGRTELDGAFVRLEVVEPVRLEHPTFAVLEGSQPTSTPHLYGRTGGELRSGRLVRVIEAPRGTEVDPSHGDRLTFPALDLGEYPIVLEARDLRVSSVLYVVSVDEIDISLDAEPMGTSRRLEATVTFRGHPVEGAEVVLTIDGSPVNGTGQVYEHRFPAEVCATVAGRTECDLFD